MPSIQLHVANAFIDAGGGGNPAGLVLDADALTASQKQAVAAIAGFSETAFVSRSRIADFKLEFFTPTRQIAHCGHATIAAFAILRGLGRVSGDRTSKETIDGRREIFFDGDMAFMEQRAPIYSALPAAGVSTADALDSLSIKASDLIDSQQPLVVNTGNSFLIVPLRSESTVAALKPDVRKVARLSEALDLIGYYAFTLQTRTPSRHAATRMFAPRYGIDEESATGMAGGPLACFLRERMGVDSPEILIEQGHLMRPPSPSVLVARLNLAQNAIQGLMVGGRAAISETKVITIA